MHAEQRRRHARRANGREIAHRIVGHLLVEARIDGVGRHRRHQQRVAVGRGFCDHIGADVAARAHLVLDDELLAEKLAHTRAHDARDRIGRTAGGKRNHHADRSRRIFLVGLRVCPDKREGHQQCGEFGVPIIWCGKLL